MKLNKSAAVELTASLWLEMYRKKTLAKHEVLKSFGFTNFDIFLYCPCCQYVSNTFDTFPGTDDNFAACAKHCPLQKLWPNGCLRYPSFYLDYILEADFDIVLTIAKVAAKKAGTWRKFDENY